MQEKVSELALAVSDESVEFPSVSYSAAYSLIELYISWQGTPELQSIVKIKIQFLTLSSDSVVESQ